MTENTKKCGFCGKSVKLRYICSTCNEVLCKSHSRIHPTTLSTYCNQCLQTELYQEVDLEMLPQLEASQTHAKRAKEKLIVLKKERTDKDQTIERLKKLIDSNLSVSQSKYENLSEKIEEGKNSISQQLSAINSLDLALIDSKQSMLKSKKRLTEVETEYTEILSEKEVVDKDISELETQIKECTEKANIYIPYDRLRKLACATCKDKIKKNLKQEIIYGNQGRKSLIDSVMASRETILSQSRYSKKPSPKSAPPDKCKCSTF